MEERTDPYKFLKYVYIFEHHHSSVKWCLTKKAKLNRAFVNTKHLQIQQICFMGPIICLIVFLGSYETAPFFLPPTLFLRAKSNNGKHRQWAVCLKIWQTLWEMPRWHSGSWLRKVKRSPSTLKLCFFWKLRHTHQWANFSTKKGTNKFKLCP